MATPILFVFAGLLRVVHKVALVQVSGQQSENKEGSHDRKTNITTYQTSQGSKQEVHLARMKT